MKLYAPSYYRSFTCIADRCKHSCCVGWEIDVDPDTMEAYAALRDGYGKSILRTIEEGETPHFRLCEGERCPHLNDKGLCKIILHLGKELLCEICREHPRFYHDTPQGREVGLGMACEEACRLILSSPDYASILPVGETEGECEALDFDAIAHRDAMLRILSDATHSYRERKETLCARYAVRLSLLSEAEALALLSSLEYLDPDHRERFLCYAESADEKGLDEQMLERALAYFIFRHVSVAGDETEARAALCFSLFCKQLLASLARAEGAADRDGMVELARTLSEEIEYSEENTEKIKEKFAENL